MRKKEIDKLFWNILDNINKNHSSWGQETYELKPEIRQKLREKLNETTAPFIQIYKIVKDVYEEKI